LGVFGMQKGGRTEKKDGTLAGRRGVGGVCTRARNEKERNLGKRRKSGDRLRGGKSLRGEPPQRKGEKVPERKESLSAAGANRDSKDSGKSQRAVEKGCLAIPKNGWSLTVRKKVWGKENCHLRVL